jgi:CMP-N-acetylneuraminic acid synthetase
MVEPDAETPELVRPCTTAMAEHARRQDAKAVYALNGAVFVYRRSLLDGLTNQFKVDRYVVYEMSRLRSVDIDEPEDLDLAEWHLERNGKEIN